MRINLLEAICNVIESKKWQPVSSSNSTNRINQQGESLEAFVKDIFAGSFSPDDSEERARAYKASFSYLGNQNNPPDFMIRGGDAVEVKKTETVSDLSLNSSYPKTHLHADSEMISKSCKEAEEWTVKDFLYAIGRLDKTTGSIERIWFVFGECYAAESEVYEKPRTVIRETLALCGLEIAQTKELGRVNKVDPLGITHMRIRGMYLLSSPEKVFGHHFSEQKNTGFRLSAVMTQKKYLSFPSISKERLRVFENEGLTFQKVMLADPNNPARELPGIVIDWIES